MNTRSFWTVLIVLMIISMLSAACGGGAATDIPETAAVTEPTKAPEPTKPAAIPEAKKPSGEITILWDEPHVHNDPYLHASVLSAVIQRQVYEPLIEFDNDGNLVGVLATSWELIDDTTWEFVLREGIKFHNGEPFTAESVRFTIAYFTGLAESPSAYYWPYIDHAEVIDDFIVRIITTQPWGAFLSMVSRYLMLPPTETAALGGEPIDFMIGTGPYKYVRWVKGSEVLLEANEDWWGGAPNIKTIRFAENMDGAVRAAAAQTGDADIVIRVPAEELNSLRANPNLEMHQTLSGRVNYWIFNAEEGPFADKRVREAAVRAIDREATGLVVQGVATATNSVGALGCAVSAGAGDLDPSLYAYDPERSKQLLAEAGYPDGQGLEGLRFICGNWTSSDVAQALQDQMAAVGIQTDLQMVDVPPLLDARRDGTYEIAAGGITCADGDGESALLRNYHTTIGAWHVGNVDIDAWMEEASTILDPDERLEEWRKIQEALWAEYPVLFLLTLTDNTAVDKQIKGFVQRPDGLVRVWEYALEE